MYYNKYAHTYVCVHMECVYLYATVCTYVLTSVNRLYSTVLDFGFDLSADQVNSIAHSP